MRQLIFCPRQRRLAAVGAAVIGISYLHQTDRLPSSPTSKLLHRLLCPATKRLFCRSIQRSSAIRRFNWRNLWSRAIRSPIFQDRAQTAPGQEAELAAVTAAALGPATEPVLAPVRTPTWAVGPIDPAVASPRPAPFISRNLNTRTKLAKRSFKAQLCCGWWLVRMATLLK